MYRHILIPTDGSELAEHAVTNGLSLAKSLGAKVSVIIVEDRSTGSAFQKRKRSRLWRNSPNIASRSRSTQRAC